MNKFTSKEQRTLVIMQKMMTIPPSTANEIINSIYEDTIKVNSKKQLIEIGWRFFVHLNKFFSPMEKDGLIKFTGKYKKGELGKMEKIWRLKCN